MSQIAAGLPYQPGTQADYHGASQVIDQISRLREKGGIGELTILTNFGGIEHWKTIKIQELFAEHVMPAFRE